VATVLRIICVCKSSGKDQYLNQIGSWINKITLTLVLLTRMQTQPTITNKLSSITTFSCNDMRRTGCCLEYQRRFTNLILLCKKIGSERNTLNDVTGAA
jgi:hypothetical protein